jgi:hypothetical protein
MRLLRSLLVALTVAVLCPTVFAARDIIVEWATFADLGTLYWGGSGDQVTHIGGSWRVGTGDPSTWNPADMGYQKDDGREAFETAPATKNVYLCGTLTTKTE